MRFETDATLHFLSSSRQSQVTSHLSNPTLGGGGKDGLFHSAAKPRLKVSDHFLGGAVKSRIGEGCHRSRRKECHEWDWAFMNATREIIGDATNFTVMSDKGRRRFIETYFRPLYMYERFSLV